MILSMSGQRTGRPLQNLQAVCAVCSRYSVIRSLWALAPKTSPDQKGLLYEGIDYRLLGEAADRVMLMTYEWGYTYGPPMAVAPLNMVRRVVEYAVSAIPVEKISLGIPNYGYEWPLPYVRGTTKAQSISNREAVARAIDHGVPIRFDETAWSPYLRYWQYGIQNEIWFEDVRSIQGKFDLIREYGLQGAGYWQLMNFFPPQLAFNGRKIPNY